MNEQVANALNSLILKSISGLEQATNFLVAEIPEVIHQLLMWNFVSSLLYSVIAWAMLGISFWSWLFWWKKVQERHPAFAAESCYKEYQVTAMICLPIIVSLTAVVNFSFTGFKFMTAIQIWIAPKVWLLEYAAQLIHK